MLLMAAQISMVSLEDSFRVVTMPTTKTVLSSSRTLDGKGVTSDEVQASQVVAFAAGL